MGTDQTPGRATRATRVRAAARTAAAAFGPNYRQARDEARGFGVVLLTRVLAWISIASVALYTVSTVISDFTSRSISVSLPVNEFWPTLPAGATITGGPTALVTSGGFSSAEVFVSGLDTAARAWLAGSSLLQGATVIMIAVVVVTLSSTILRNDPFQPAVARGIRLLGVTVIGGGLGWQICSGMGESLASSQVLQLGSAELKNVITWDNINTIIGFPQPTPHIQVDFWPIGVGLVMLVLAAAFRYGERLRRDTDGLV
jgi:hypothetical protein